MKYPVSEPDLGPLELRYVEDAVRSTWISSSGKYLDRFESEFAEIVTSHQVLAVSNGTVALHLILLGLGIGPGDEVIVPTFTYIASVNAIKYVGAAPVFVDVSSQTWGIEATTVEAAISPRTKAIIGVHLYGQPFDLGPIVSLAKKYNVHLVEDAAEAPFSTYKGVPVGSFGIASSFSFYGNKVITSGEGGAIATSDSALADRMRVIRSQGMDPNQRYFFPVIGHNFRLTNVAAAILCAQLERLPDILAKRHELCEAYDIEIGSIQELSVQQKMEWSTWTPWLASVTLDERYKGSRSKLLTQLDSRGVETRPFFIPVHQMPPYRNEEVSDIEFPVSCSVAQLGFNLPTSSNMSTQDARNIMDIVKTSLTLSRV